MINLMPTEDKKNIRYARINTSLRRWIAGVSLGVIGLLVILGAGHMFINRSIETKRQEVEQARQQLSVERLDETQNRISEISNSVRLAIDVLSQQVLFSKLFQEIGSVMPSGAALQNLSIASLEGAIDLEVAATDYQTATQVQINLEDQTNNIFVSSDIINVSCPDEITEESGEYPCSVSLRALFAEGNEFQFVSDGASQ